MADWHIRVLLLTAEGLEVQHSVDWFAGRAGDSTQTSGFHSLLRGIGGEKQLWCILLHLFHLYGNVKKNNVSNKT